MRTGLLAAVAGLFALAGLAVAQERPSDDSGRTAATGQRSGRAQPSPVTSPPEPAGLARVGDDGCDPGGDSGCKPACGPCGPFGHIWGSAEYLRWCIRGTSLPPLVTTGP